MSIPHRGVLYQVAKNFVRRLLAADGSSEGRLHVEFVYTVPDAATGDIDIVVNEKVEVVDVVCIKRNGAGAGNTMQIKDGSNNTISDVIACATDDALTRAATITDTGGRNIIAAGGTLRLTATRAAGTRDALVRVLCLPRP